MPTTPEDLQKLLEQARQEGALAAEVLAEVTTGHKLVVEDGRPTVQETPASAALTVRVWVAGGRVGEFTGGLQDGPELIGQALAATFQSPEDPTAGPVARLNGPAGGLGTEDRRYANLTVEDRLDVIGDCERQARGPDSRFRPGPFAYTDSRTWRALVNTKGVSFEESSTAYSLSGSLDVEDLHIEDRTDARSFSSIASMPMGTRLVQRAQKLLVEGQTLEPGPVRVSLPPRAVGRLFALLGEQFDPAILQGDAFFLTAVPPGEQVVDARIHLVDDGVRPGALRTRRFDDRGVPPVPLTLLKEGRVDARFLTPEAARALDTRPTGHCYGGGLRATNLLLRGGTRSLNALLAERGGPSLRVDDLPNLGDLDLATGAFDWTVSGVVMSGNKPVGAMRNVRVTGNLREVLNAVIEVTSDTDRIGHVDAPAMILEGFVLEV